MTWSSLFSPLCPFPAQSIPRFLPGSPTPNLNGVYAWGLLIDADLRNHLHSPLSQSDLIVPYIAISIPCTRDCGGQDTALTVYIPTD